MASHDPHPPRVGHALVTMTTRFGTTRRRAHTVHRFGAVQSEHSLRGRNLEDRSLDDDTRVLLTCRELRIGIVPYSPLGRGFLGGRLPDPARLQDNDYRRHDPRFQGEHHEHNRRLLVAVNAVAARHEAKPAQVALAWLLARGPDIVPIPGTKRRSYLGRAPHAHARGPRRTRRARPGERRALQRARHGDDRALAVPE
jgi:aryl-alcohol dehydrogenase-like predicted oxidoreductase